MTAPDGPARWARVKELLADALDLPEASRAAFLSEACGDDAELRREIEALILEHEARGPLEDVAQELRGLVGPTRPFSAGDPIGRFRVVREIGSGGMGTVYLAERVGADFEQRVAIKVVAGGLAGAGLSRRLRAERRILARLDHPGIARFIDGDVTPEGQPYLVMEYVEGRPIDEYADRARLDVRARVELLRDVLDAVQCAHRHLVVHQDVKPTNILVRDDGAVKLLDFGIALLLEDGAARSRRLLGGHTPGFASPEQRRGEPATPATDVYALGVLLHLLLTGALPSAEDGAPSATPLTDDAASRRRTSADRLRGAIRGDLDAIVRRALAADAGDRYPTVERLDADLRAWLEMRPVEARPAGWGYRVGRFARRNRLAVGAAAALVVALAGGLVGTTLQARRAAEAASLAAAERDLSRQISSLLVGMFELSDPGVALGETITAREILDRAYAQVDRTLAGQPDAQARMLLEIGRVYHNLGLNDQARGAAERSLTIHRASPGFPSLAATDALRLAADLSAEAGDSEAGAELLAEALARLREGLPDTRLAVAGTLLELGHVNRVLARHTEAEAAWTEALDLARAGPDPDGLVGDILFGLALASHDRGDFGAAEDRFREVVAHLPVGDTGPGGRPTPVAALARHRLGQILMVRRDLAGAELLLREALAIQDRVLDPGHVDRLATLRTLATVLANADRRPEAVLLLEEAVELLVVALGGDHVDVAQSRYVLGAAMAPIGREVEGARLLSQAIAVYERTYGTTHPYLVNPALGLAQASLRAGDLSAAEHAGQLALTAARSNYGDDHSFVVLATAFMARLGAARDGAAVAEPRLREAADAAREAFGPDHRNTIAARIALADALRELGRLEEAEGLYRRASDGIRAISGDRSPLYGDAEAGLGMVLAARGDATEARDHLGAALRSREASHPADHAAVVSLRTTLERLRDGG